MKIGIDIDCVCNNLVHEWLAYLNMKHNLNVKYEDITSYNMKQFFPMLSDEQIYEPLNIFSFWNSLQPIEDSAKYLKQLRNDGHTIKLITATDVNSMPVKCRWVSTYYPFINIKDIWMVHDKGWIDADILLDDCMDNLEKGNYLSVCFNQPWNQCYSGLRVNNWKEFYNLIKEKMVKHNEFI